MQWGQSGHRTDGRPENRTEEVHAPSPQPGWGPEEPVRLPQATSSSATSSNITLTARVMCDQASSQASHACMAQPRRAWRLEQAVGQRERAPAGGAAFSCRGQGASRQSRPA